MLGIGDGEPRLADTAGADDRHEPCRLEHRLDAGDVAVATVQSRSERRDPWTRRFRGRFVGAMLRHDQVADELVAATMNGTDEPLGLAVVTDRLASRLDAAGQRRLR